MELILNTKLVMIFKTQIEYQVLITCEDGTVIEHAPFPLDQRGLVAALDVAMNVLAGKFWLKKIGRVTDAPELPQKVLIDRSKK